MNATEYNSTWLKIVHDNADILRQIVADWHPSDRFPKALQKESILISDGDAIAVDSSVSAEFPITAPQAEIACREARLQIRQTEPDNPLERWDKAIQINDVGEILSLLEGTWLGVPESSACWQINGFSLMCNLLDDPPDPPEYDDES